MNKPASTDGEHVSGAKKIDFQPLGRRGQCTSSDSILDCARHLGLGISSVCGGHGTCRSCRIRILGGRVSSPTSIEQEALSAGELQEGWRLACQAYPISDCKVHVPPESMTTPQRTQVEGIEVPLAPEPRIQTCQVELTKASLSDPQADADRLLAALGPQCHLQCHRLDIGVLGTLSDRLRSCGWRVQVRIRDDEVIALGDPDSPRLGLAVDLGTTKIAGYLLDLASGQTLASEGIMNPQISYGEDVISRVTSIIRSPEQGAEMRKQIVETLNDLALTLAAAAGVNTRDIVDAVMVGNTAMHHIFLQLPVRQLALSPYIPAATLPLDVKARDAGLEIASGAYVHFLPNIAGFVGADHAAVLLATEAVELEGPTIIIDIGTNTEVTLADQGQLASVSCASGPAFEGGHIEDGMRAAAGAIERIQISNGIVLYQTIGEGPPAGICGSGILDGMAQLHINAIIDDSGRIKDNHARIRSRNNRREFVVVSEEERDGDGAIVITQKDIRELQLAKAAIRTGIQVLLETRNLREEDLAQVIIAGAFGTYINVDSAMQIGMLPALPLDRFSQVGNAAGMGAKLALISHSKRIEAANIVKRVRYIELASSATFRKNFVQSSYLGRYRIMDGHRELIPTEPSPPYKPDMDASQLTS